MGKTLPSLPTRIEMTEITQPGLFMETPEIIQPDPAHAYAALARHVTAIDIALKYRNAHQTRMIDIATFKDVQELIRAEVEQNRYVQGLIRAEVEAAMGVIHRYESCD